MSAMMDLDRQSPAAAHWSRLQYEDLFAITSSQPRSERLSLVVDDESGPPPETVSSQAPGILAFLVAHRVDSEWELENIVVADAARRRGVGRGLLSEFVAHARTGNANAIFLEVRKSNESARALYRKAGFEETGLRKSYYSNPTEDAILCRLSFY
jgi:ribosomal-protein-alanine N-acetyltransferase